MNGTHNESGGAGLPTNGEDLNVVLGRFQSWAATRATTQSATPAGKARAEKGAVPDLGKLSGDAREISYDQALRASRYRRPESVPALDPIPNSAKPAKARGTDEPARADKMSSQATTDWNQAEDLEVKPWEHRWPEVRFAKTRPAATSTEPRAGNSAPVSAAPPVQMASAKAAPRASEKAASIPAVAKKTSAVQRDIRSASGIKAARTVADAHKAEPLRPATPSRRSRHQPEFSEVLKGTAALAAASTGSASLANGKSTTLTLRVSDGEQARIQACAAQANLSVSAYLRQCALGVDELRGQVEVALAKVRKEQEKPIQPPGIAAIPGILRRFGMKYLQRFRRTSDQYSAVSIR